MKFDLFILSIYIPDRDEKQETSEQMDERIYKGYSFQLTKIQQILQIYKSFYKKIDIFFEGYYRRNRRGKKTRESSMTSMTSMTSKTRRTGKNGWNSV